MKILLPKNIVDQFKRQAIHDYPLECCGFLIGQRDNGQTEAKEYIPANNSRKNNKERRFIIDPREYIDAEDRADSQNLSLVGIVHSHPDSPDKPSVFDRDHAFCGFSYVIISVTKDAVQGFRSWRLTEDRERFVEETVSVMNHTSS